MNTKIQHKGWDWDNVNNEAWDNVSSEFLPISFEWGKKFSSMIDIGAGRGRHALYMNSMGLETTAVDLSESSIEIINEKNRQQGGSVRAFVSDMTELPFEDGSFDCAICFHAIYHTDFSGMIKAVNEIKRVLKKGGEVFVTFNSKENPSFRNGVSVDNYTIYKTSGIEENIPHTYVDYEDICKIMDGFKLIKVQQIENYIYKGNPAGGKHYYVLAQKL